MSEQEKQEGQKTVVAFVAGLLIGGLLVWIFSTPGDTEVMVDESADEVSEEMIDESQVEESVDPVEETVSAVRELTTGDGEVNVDNQEAGSVVNFESITFPISEGWIAVRSYTDENLGNILGASRFSEEQGLVPESVQLLAPTVSGRDYAVVFFTENGDRAFNLASDVQIDGIFGTFTAN